jgi:hypothetical protein
MNSRSNLYEVFEICRSRGMIVILNESCCSSSMCENKLSTGSNTITSTGSNTITSTGSKTITSTGSKTTSSRGNQKKHFMNVMYNNDFITCANDSDEKIMEDIDAEGSCYVTWTFIAKNKSQESLGRLLVNIFQENGYIVDYDDLTENTITVVIEKNDLPKSFLEKWYISHSYESDSPEFLEKVDFNNNSSKQLIDICSESSQEINNEKNFESSQEINNEKNFESKRSDRLAGYNTASCFEQNIISLQCKDITNDNTQEIEVLSEESNEMSLNNKLDEILSEDSDESVHFLENEELQKYLHKSLKADEYIPGNKSKEISKNKLTMISDSKKKVSNKKDSKTYEKKSESDQRERLAENNTACCLENKDEKVFYRVLNVRVS